MTTYKRTCLKNYKIKYKDKNIFLEKDKIYITSKIYNKKYVTVFTNYWITNIPINIFGESLLFTGKN